MHSLNNPLLSKIVIVIVSKYSNSISIKIVLVSKIVIVSKYTPKLYLHSLKVILKIRKIYR